MSIHHVLRNKEAIQETISKYFPNDTLMVYVVQPVPDPAIILKATLPEYCDLHGIEIKESDHGTP